MGFRTFVARGLLVSFFIVAGVSMVSNPTVYEGALRTGLERASSRLHLLTGLAINPSLILANAKSAISLAGGALLCNGVLTILGVKFAAVLMLIFISVGASIFYNPVLATSEAEGKHAMINLLKSLAVIGGLLIVLYGTPGTPGTTGTPEAKPAKVTKEAAQNVADKAQGQSKNSKNRKSKRE
jgi:hypothetical protein